MLMISINKVPIIRANQLFFLRLHIKDDQRRFSGSAWQVVAVMAVWLEPAFI